MISDEDKVTLLKLLKTKLNITYTESDEQLCNIISNAVPDLTEKIGNTDIDFTSNGAEQSLFLNYCKYCFFGQEDTFFDRYKNEFLSLREIYNVKSNDEDTSDE